MRARHPRTVLFVTVFMDLVGFGIVLPLLPVYARHWGASALTNGLLLAVYSLMQFLFAPAWGHLSDRAGRRPILLISLGGSVLGYALFGLAGLWHSIPLLFLSRLLSGVMGANIAVAQAVIADTTSARDRAHGMGLIGAAFGLGFILGPVFAAVLVRFGDAGPGVGAAAICAVNFLLALRGLPETLAPEHRHGARRGEGHVAVLTHAARMPGVRGLLAMFLMFTVAQAIWESVLPVFGAMRFGWDEREIAHLFIFVGILAAVMQGWLVRRLRRFAGEATLLHWGAAAAALAFAVLALTPRVAVHLGALALLAFAIGACNPSMLALLSRRAGPSEQGRLLGVSQSLASLGRVIGPLLGYGLIHGAEAGALPALTVRGVESLPFVLAALLASTVWLASLRVTNPPAMDSPAAA